jgi:hypothetical protein
MWTHELNYPKVIFVGPPVDSLVRKIYVNGLSTRRAPSEDILNKLKKMGFYNVSIMERDDVLYDNQLNEPPSVYLEDNDHVMLDNEDRCTVTKDDIIRSLDSDWGRTFITSLRDKKKLTDKQISVVIKIVESVREKLNVSKEYILGQFVEDGMVKKICKKMEV